MEEVFLIINYYEPTPIKGEGLVVDRYGSIHSIHIELDVEHGSLKQSKGIGNRSCIKVH